MTAPGNPKPVPSLSVTEAHPKEEYYCPEHKYNPPENSGLALCPQCEFGEKEASSELVNSPQQNELKPISDEAVEAATGYMDYLVRHGIISIADTDLTATLAEHIQSAITKALKRAEISVSEDKQTLEEKEA